MRARPAATAGKQVAHEHGVGAQPARAQAVEMLAAQAQAIRARRASRRAELFSEWERRADQAVSFALAQRGKPYVWGGTGQPGFDCSGLVHTAWRKAGVSIPRVSHSQLRGIRKHVDKDELRPGDLVFFRGGGHVGMYVGDGKYVHAPHSGRTVSVEKLDDRSNFVGAVRPGWPAEL
ncbi:glycoside hydrolase [Actinomadura craniellae]|uniref:Glycoside hydrolase n=1 Tax=Actinomadura craniellae TaxID=2231787 RepID=A0A365GZF8_9ACTN|nr:C40 family peptidase [Actinomadura craniellae]RAY12219.1 glycoside hydrolase [Actinomadura craniellae]